MSAEDWQVYKDMRAHRKTVRRQRREAFDGGPGWTRHHETHWSYTLLGDRLDYWPGPKTWRWRGRKFRGEVYEFIQSRERRE